MFFGGTHKFYHEYTGLEYPINRSQLPDYAQGSAEHLTCTSPRNRGGTSHGTRLCTIAYKINWLFKVVEQNAVSRASYFDASGFKFILIVEDEGSDCLANNNRKKS